MSSIDEKEFSTKISKQVEYNASDIQILEGLEAVRKRPGMYIGSTGIDGLHHLVYEIVDNAIDESLAGFCTNINVSINSDDSISVSDDGRGIPVDIHEDTGSSALTVVFTVLHAGGKFGGGSYKVSSGLHGVGASVVNALSEYLVVNVFKDGKVYHQRFERGKSIGNVEVKGDTDKTGTEIIFKADNLVFETLRYDFDVLIRRFREQAFLNPGLSINLTDFRSNNSEAKIDDEEYKNPSNSPKCKNIRYDGGIKEFVAYLNKTKNSLHESVIYISNKRESDEFEVAMQYTDAYNEKILSFANGVNTVGGGTHEVGFKSALTKTLNEYSRKYQFLKESDKDFIGEDCREGLTVVINVRTLEAQFEGQTKTKLGNSEIRTFVDANVKEKLMMFLEENPSISKLIVEKIISAAKAREASRKARELIRKKNTYEISSLVTKLADCSEKDKSFTEIYIVEGDSAGGSAKQGRDRRFQAILPLWGKMLNVEKARTDKVYGNEKFMPMIVALGAGIGDDFDVSKLRYNKVVIMADADVDGSHIRTLLLTFFFRFMSKLIEMGHVYIAQPPLYKISKGKSVQYAYNDSELQKILKQIGTETSIQRFKGLGEMNPDQLWETTMNPETRIMLRVTMKDAEIADETFSALMGDKVEPRREFIELYADNVVNLDV